MVTSLNSSAEMKPALVPYPKSIELGEGQIKVQRINYQDATLKRLSEVLQTEIERVSGQELKVVRGRSQKGDIVLAFDKSLKGEAYSVKVTDRTLVSGGNYNAVGLGTVTVLQALDGLTIAKMTVKDEPAMAYRGFLIDVARKYHSVATLKQCIDLCRLYKVRYLQIHLSDDQSFTFPSTKYPQINSSQHHGGPTYTLAELKELEQYAVDRGVAIVPEIEMPGHNATLLRTLPDIMKIKGTKPYEHSSTINYVKEEALKVMDDIIGEVCAVFKSTPYFHLGGDEADISLADQNEDFKKAFVKHGLGEHAQHEMFRWFLNRMNETVKKHGKKTIVWEGFGRDPGSKFPISKDITVMEFESAYYVPDELVVDGHTVINACWTPLYTLNEHVWPAKKVYDWNPYRFGRYSMLYSTTGWFQLDPTPGIIGAQICSWEQNEAVAIANARRILPALCERVWNPKSNLSYDHFEARLAHTEELLDRLVHVVQFDVKGLEKGGPDDKDLRAFPQSATVAMSAPAGYKIHYTLDGSIPSVQSPVYGKPIELTGTTFVRAIAFGVDSKQVGLETGNLFVYRPHPVPNLATRKPVTASSGTQAPQNPELVVDGKKELGSCWWAAPAPQWIQVDLEKVTDVGRIKVYPYWDGKRYYQYTVETSADGRNWSIVLDKSQNTVPANDSGDEVKLTGAKLRYIRVNMSKCSVNEGVHIVEIEAFEPGK